MTNFARQLRVNYYPEMPEDAVVQVVVIATGHHGDSSTAPDVVRPNSAIENVCCTSVCVEVCTAGADQVVAANSGWVDRSRRAGTRPGSALSWILCDRAAFVFPPIQCAFFLLGGGVFA